MIKQIIILTLGLATIINAQGITNTLGGNTAADKFVVENSDSEAGLVVTGEGNTGIGTTNPLSKLSVGGDGESFSTIYGETSLSHGGRGVTGFATNASGSGNIGGYFVATGTESYGVFGKAEGIRDYAVYGWATDTGWEPNYGGFFTAMSKTGRGVSGYALNTTGNEPTYGGYFEANSQIGRGVYGSSAGRSGYGVYGFASNSDGEYNYGVYGKAAGNRGFGVYGQALGTKGRGVYGHSYGAEGYGVYGIAYSEEGTNYGGRFISNGHAGTGVYGSADNTGNNYKYGGYFTASGDNGTGVYGISTGTNGKGVVAYGNAYDFFAEGPNSVNYGIASSIRWKTNIIEIDAPLEKLAELRGVYFNWDEEHGGRRDVGCIAEEVGKILPEIVVYEENGIDANGMDYSMLTPLLIEVTKAQQKLIEDLTERIEHLESKQN